MYREPAIWHALLDVLAEQFARYVAAQVEAGADVIQLFDSWVGALSPADYEEFVAPYSARILAAVDVPTIHFGTGVTEQLLRALTRAGGDVIGLDWRMPLDRGWEVVGEERGVQGNLDPAVLLGPWERVEAAALDVLARAGGRAGHIFNLGHGVLPQTDPGVLTRLAGLVQERTRARRVSERRRRADGVRLAGAARRRACVLRRHPRRAGRSRLSTSTISSSATAGSGSRTRRRSTRSPSRRAPRSSASSGCRSSPA